MSLSGKWRPLYFSSPMLPGGLQDLDKVISGGGPQAESAKDMAATRYIFTEGKMLTGVHLPERVSDEEIQAAIQQGMNVQQRVLIKREYDLTAEGDNYRYTPEVQGISARDEEKVFLISQEKEMLKVNILFGDLYLVQDK